jgi:hypothetical protein
MNPKMAYLYIKREWLMLQLIGVMILESIINFMLREK